MFQHLLWHSPGRISSVIGASMLIVAIVFWVYWQQVRELRVPWRWMLPSLRGVALVVLVISLIQPVIVRPRTSAERGAIVLLMDRSASMSVVDANRTPSQLVALADGFKSLPPGIRPRDAATLDQAPDTLKSITDQLFLTRGQLDYARIAGQSTDAPSAKLQQLSRQAGALADLLSNYPHASHLAQELAVLAGQIDLPADQWSRELGSLNDTLSTAIAQAQTSADNDLYRSNDAVRTACDDISALSRAGLVDRALTSPQMSILGALLSQAPVFGFSFADSFFAVPLQRQDGSSLKSIPIAATGAQSNISAALSAIRDKMQGKPVQAIVLFSDGRQVGTESDLAPILSTSAAPIFAVNCAGPVHKDLAVVQMSSPQNLYVNEPGVVSVELACTGCHDLAIDVALDVDGQRQTQRVTMNDGSGTRANFQVNLPHAGVHQLTAVIPPQPGEATHLNNQIQHWVKVFGDPIHVLAVSSWPGWDFQYLRHAVEAAPYMNLQAMIAPGEGVTLQLSPQQILQQNVIVLSDVRADALSAEQWQAVHDLVTKQGGSVVIVPGDPKNLLDISQQAHMADLLPMQNPGDAVWRVWPGEQPYFHFAMPADQIADTSLLLSEDRTASAQMWPQLSGMFRFMPILSAKSQVRTLLVDSDSRLPVLTEMPAGAGRAFFFGARETWRWRQGAILHLMWIRSNCCPGRRFMFVRWFRMKAQHPWFVCFVTKS
jgi:hypothetical protein